MSRYHICNKWDFRFLKLAREVSTWSKDGTKIGAVLVRPDKTVASVGFNGLPRGIEDQDYLGNRELKNKFVIHAEQNAILFCSDKDTNNYTMYGWGLHPCAHCASVLAQKNIKRIVSIDAAKLASPSWKEAQFLAEEILKKCNIDNDHYTIEEFEEGYEYINK